MYFEHEIIKNTILLFSVLLCDFDDAESNSKPFPCRCDSIPCQLTEISPDSYKWSPMRGKTPSDATGPDYDHTQQNDNGQYIYAEASQIVPGSVAQIQTPSLQLGTTSCLTFYYHMFGQHIGSLVVSAMFTNGSYGTLYTLDGEQGGEDYSLYHPSTVIVFLISKFRAHLLEVNIIIIIIIITTNNNISISYGRIT